MLAKGSQDISMKGGGLTVSDVFSTYVYTGTGTTQDIVNGIDLATEGGLVWMKCRNIATYGALTDTIRGGNNTLYPSETTAETDRGADFITSFNADGFSLGADGLINDTYDYASWTFRKAPKFFDVVTYTGNGVAGREIAHELGCDVGMMFVKDLNNAQNWAVYHISKGNAIRGRLNSTDMFYTTTSHWDSTTPTDAIFTLGDNWEVNRDATEYVAYLFAHNETDGLVEGDGNPVIKCGSYTTTDGGVLGGVANIELGWEPQFVMIKGSSFVRSWKIIDTVRGATAENGAGSNYTEWLQPNDSAAEVHAQSHGIHSTGFSRFGETVGETFIYMAIARDTTTVPTSSDEVFAIDLVGDTTQPNYLSSFPVDMYIRQYTTANSHIVSSRLTGANRLVTDSSNAESGDINAVFDYMDGVRDETSPYEFQFLTMFKRAHSFFDVVTYTGDRVDYYDVQTINHNLGVEPSMIWLKGRSDAYGWIVRVITGAVNKRMVLNSNAIGYTSYTAFSSGSINSDSFGVKQDYNASGATYIAYLFATLDGISSVFSYTGNGTSIDVDMGFTTGLKFIIIKRTDSTGDWYLCDVERGLTNFLKLNTTDAQASGSGIASSASGAVVTQNATTNLNVLNGEYIGYGVANGI